MRRSLLPAGLVLATALVDAVGAHGLAYYVLLSAVVATAIAALESFGNLVELSGSNGLRLARWEAACAGCALALALVAAAVRSGSSVPPIGTSALLACLAVFTIQGLTHPAARDSRLEGQTLGRVSSEVDQRLDREERADHDRQRSGD